MTDKTLQEEHLINNLKHTRLHPAEFKKLPKLTRRFIHQMEGLAEKAADALDAKDKRIAELEAKIIENAEDFAEYNRAEGELMEQRDELAALLNSTGDER